jgi:hypothetical protein
MLVLEQEKLQLWLNDIYSTCSLNIKEPNGYCQTDHGFLYKAKEHYAHRLEKEAI